MADMLYTVEKECPVCKKKLPVTKTRGRQKLVRQDSDFCSHFAGDINPYYYSIWVCPHCGFAAPDSSFENLSAAAEEKLREFLKGKVVKLDLSGRRSREQAITAYKLAIYFGEQFTGLRNSTLAELYLKLGWLYREGGQAAEEAAALDRAREYYERALVREHPPFGNLSALAVEYLIGELFRRTGRFDEAIAYLGKVVYSPEAKAEHRLREMAREAWQAARQAKASSTASRQESASRESESQLSQ